MGYKPLTGKHLDHQTFHELLMATQFRSGTSSDSCWGKVSADCTFVRGSPAGDESAVTGEPHPATIQIGVAVIGGSHASRKGYRPRSNREACRGRTEEIPSARRQRSICEPGGRCPPQIQHSRNERAPPVNPSSMFRLRCPPHHSNTGFGHIVVG